MKATVKIPKLCKTWQTSYWDYKGISLLTLKRVFHLLVDSKKFYNLDFLLFSVCAHKSSSFFLSRENLSWRYTWYIWCVYMYICILAFYNLLLVAKRKKVAACAKHYVGDGGTNKGFNENNTVIDRHGLLSIHMPGYYHSIIKGVSTVMVSFSSWNGVKMHANRNLVTEFLKNTLRFRVQPYTLTNFLSSDQCKSNA